MSITHRYLILSFVSLIVCLSSCGREEECMTEDITYTNFIGTLMDQKCSNIGCHISGAPMGSLANYEEVVAFPSLDKMVDALRHEDGLTAMPKNGDMLSECEIDKIEAWIEAGTPE